MFYLKIKFAVSLMKSGILDQQVRLKLSSRLECPRTEFHHRNLLFYSFIFHELHGNTILPRN